MFYDPVALAENADNFIEQAIKSNSSPIPGTPAPVRPPAMVSGIILMVDMISSLKVKYLKAELQKRGRGVTGNNHVLASRLKWSRRRLQ